MGTVRVAADSPRLERNIGITLVGADVDDGDTLRVQTPEGWREASLTSLPFL